MNSTIVKKISLLSGAALVLLGVTVSVAWRQHDQVLANQQEMQQATTALRHQLEADMMHDALRADVLAALHGSAIQSREAVGAARNSFAEHARHFREETSALRETRLPPEAAAAIRGVALTLETYVQAAADLVTKAGENRAAAEAGWPAFLEQFHNLETKMAAVSDSITAAHDAAAGANVTVRAAFRRHLVTAVGANVVCLSLLTLLVSRSVPGTFRPIVAALRRIGGAARESSIQVASASQSLASGTSEAAASLEETSASLEEMASMTQRTATNASAARELGTATRHAADAGASDMQVMSEAMLAIKNSSDNIAKIIKTIDEIAFQTNLLALNAAVEAARAGEAGQGFAVVADEVRALAQRSAQAARETAAKIEDSIAKSQHGVQISTKVNASLADIVNKVREMDDLINEIAVATSEQSQGIAQINSAVAQLDRVTQSTAENSGAIAAAAEQLEANADRINQGIAQLETLVGPEAATAKATALPPPPAAAAQGQARAALPAGTDRATAVIPSSRAKASLAPASVSESELMKWEAATMSTGDETIDAQHQELFRQINKLHVACVSGADRRTVKESFDFLSRYVQEHFRHEEHVMADRKCPSSRCNQQAHQKFLSDYGQLLKTFEKHGPCPALVGELKLMVQHWLVNHIVKIDTQLRGCAACPKKTLSSPVNI